jgi:uncharacterized protein (DUF2235 family)
MSEPRNLVICCDGTNNQIAGPATNVRRLYSMLVRDEKQLTYYDSGVGTTPAADFLTSWGRTLGKALDGAIGLSIRHHMLKAYRFLVTHYQPGDRIWLFGFSRGAYTARALAAALFSFGLLRPELLGLEDLLWENFDRLRGASRTGTKKHDTTADADLSPDDEDQENDNDHEEKPTPRKKTKKKEEPNFFHTAAKFRTTFSRTDDPSWWTGTHYRVRIHFCGVWDTVSAFGTFVDEKTLPYTSQCPSLVHVRHAMALDERRTMFRANLFKFQPKETKKTVKYLESLKQVWFPGVHSDVGGGYPQAESQLAKIALEWMIQQSEALGLRIDQRKRGEIMNGEKKFVREYGPAADPLADAHESLEGLWNAVELMCTRRFDGQQNRERWFAPNLWRPRPVQNFDMNGVPIDPVLHQSVLTRMEGRKDYRPKNLPPEGKYTIEPAPQ